MKVLLFALLLCLLGACKKDDKLGPFAGTVWQGKKNVTHVISPKTFGYRITFSTDGKYRVTELDEMGYAYKEESRGIYSYTPPKLTLRSVNGTERVYEYEGGDETFWGYNYLVTFFKQ